MLSSALYLYRHFVKPLETQVTTPHIDFLSLESERSFVYIVCSMSTSPPTWVYFQIIIEENYLMAS